MRRIVAFWNLGRIVALREKLFLNGFAHVFLLCFIREQHKKDTLLNNLGGMHHPIAR